jgi:ribosomal protein S18 acetylase RimI-like enzyme
LKINKRRRRLPVLSRLRNEPHEPFVEIGFRVKSLKEVSAMRQATVFKETLEGIDRGPSFSWNVEMLEHQIREDQGLFIENKEGILGFIIWRALGSEAEVLCLATAPRFRRAGWMEKLLRSLFDANRHVCSWWIEVHPLNVGALNLYTKLGFQKMAERKAYYPDGAPALILLKTITP